ncbi:proton-coupled folate transporter-like [Ruditapes philippinarum]|uniref:proton-coupled folate transporter-like n=1 Tax=Ruditapes philippinarum TaxID=129788 RepID=UPI00295ABE3A|nr:proton-coupled folate transporter-like [Ruditapes philippinarum]
MATQPNSPSGLRKANDVCMNFLDSIQSYIVEAAYFMFFLARHMSLPLFQEYVSSETYKQKHLNPRDADIEGKPVNETLLYHDAQRESTVTILSLQIAEGLPAVVAVIILGALSDRTGRRKILLWLPALGSTIYCLIYILIQYTGWALDGLFMASAVRGLSGSMTAFLAGGSYYAINVVKPHQRSSRLALQELLNGAAYAVANIMAGFWVASSDYSFLEPFWFCFICSLISFLLSFFLVKEIEPNRSPRRDISGNCCIDTFGPMGRFFRCRGNIKLVRIWLAILAFQTYAIVHLGQINTLVLYLLGEPMAWPVNKIGVFLSVAMACAAMSTGMVPPFLRNYVTDVHIAFAGFLSKALGTLWITVVHNDTAIYFGILLLVCELLPFPMMRAIVAKDISPSEQGSLFALMHCGESISYFLAPLMFQAIYADTLHYYAGFVFIVSVMLLVLPVGFTFGIVFIDKRVPAEEPYETMDGESELLPNETIPDGSQPPQSTEPVARVMTTSLSGSQPSISVIGDKV